MHFTYSLVCSKWLGVFLGRKLLMIINILTTKNIIIKQSRIKLNP